MLYCVFSDNILKKKKKRKDFTENSSGGQLFKKPAASWLECVFIKYIGPKFYR